MLIVRRNLPLLILLVVLLAVLAWAVYLEESRPSVIDTCHLGAAPRERVPDGWEAANLTEAFLDEHPMLRMAMAATAPTQVDCEEMVATMRAVEELGATTRGTGDPHLVSYVRHEGSVYQLSTSRTAA